MPDRRKCSNCWHGRDSGCKLYSSRCVTEVFNRVEEPTHWMEFMAGFREEASQMLRKKEVSTWIV